MLICGLIWTAGFATAVVGHLNLLSVAFAVLFIGLGVDFGIHLALRFAEEFRNDVEKSKSFTDCRTCCWRCDGIVRDIGSDWILCILADGLSGAR